MRHTDSLPVVRELFHVLFWLATRYAPTPDERPLPGLPFDAAGILKPQPGIVAKTLAQLQALDAELKRKDEELANAQAQNDELQAELISLREQVAIEKARNATVPDTHDYREDETRDLFIDVLLREAGWALDAERDREFPVTGMPNDSAGGTGYVDYVLWGEGGLPLGVVEAKRTRKDANVGQQQAKLYAGALEARYQLALVIQRPSIRTALATLPVAQNIVDRHYRQSAVRKAGEAFEGKERRALVVMATGSGKTRTVIALSDLLVRSNWAKRILFLADRVALVNQTANAFKQLMPDASPEEILLAERLAGLPSSTDVLDTDEQAERFDLFALRAQLGVLVGDPGFDAAKRRIQAIVNALAEQKSIPAVAAQIELIAAMASRSSGRMSRFR